MGNVNTDSFVFSPGSGFFCLLAGCARLRPDTQPRTNESTPLEAAVASPGYPQAGARLVRTTTATAAQQPQPVMAGPRTNKNSVIGSRPCHVARTLHPGSVTPANRSRHSRPAASVVRNWARKLFCALTFLGQVKQQLSGHYAGF